MQIKHTMYCDEEGPTFEGSIVDDAGNIFTSDDLDEFMAAVELFHENDDSLEGIDQIDLDMHVLPEIKASDDNCKRCEAYGSPECVECPCNCEDEEDDEDDKEDDEDDEEDDGFFDDWDVIDVDAVPILTRKVVHVHSIELLALAAAGVGLWKLVKKFFKR